MRHQLLCHPDTPCSAIDAMFVDIARRGEGEAMVRYVARGKIEKIKLPEFETPKRADGLWQTSCFEAFVRSENALGYGEYNFAPSTCWAAYDFDGYRKGMRPKLAKVPRIVTLAESDHFELWASFQWLTSEKWMLGLSAVIEEVSGAKSYWALAHPSGAPDFHHEDCFALTLPATGEA